VEPLENADPAVACPRRQAVAWFEHHQHGEDHADRQRQIKIFENFAHVGPLCRNRCVNRRF